jgi:hypothetical protein
VEGAQDGFHHPHSRCGAHANGASVLVDAARTLRQRGRFTSGMIASNDRNPARGPSRYFVATQQFSRFLSEADIQRAALTEPDL